MSSRLGNAIVQCTWQAEADWRVVVPLGAGAQAACSHSSSSTSAFAAVSR